MSEYNNHVHHKFKPIIELAKLGGDAESSFHVDGSFGDIYFQLSILRELLDSGGDFKVFIEKKYVELASIALRSQVPILPIQSLWLREFQMRYGILGRVPYLPIPLLPTVYPVISELCLNGSLSYLNFLRSIAGLKGPFKSNLLISIEGDRELKEAFNLLKTNDLPVKRTVVLCPTNNTWAEFPEAFWLELIDRLLLENIVPLLNHPEGDCPNTRRIYGKAIKIIKVPAHLCVSLVRCCGGYVSGNNGFASIQYLLNRQVYGAILNLVSNNENAPNSHIINKNGDICPIINPFHAQNYKGIKRSRHLELIQEKETSYKKTLDKIMLHLCRLKDPISSLEEI